MPQKSLQKILQVKKKLPTGGNGNYSISLDSLADYTKTKKDLADNTTVDGKVNGVRQELDDHIEDLLNPHQVTKGQIGLGNVDNTADADYASYVSIDECKHYPPITGNNTGNFGVYSIRGSHIKFSNGGYSFEESDLTTNPNVENFVTGDNTNIASNSSASSGAFGLIGNAGRWNTSLMRIGDVRLWWDTTAEVLRAKNFQTQ